MTFMGTQIMAQLTSVYSLISQRPASEERNKLIDQFLAFADQLRGIRNEEIHTNTRLNYLYRDASNYKTMNSVVLAGKMTDEQFAEMQECCEDHHEMFVPEQLGLDLIRDWETTADDHPWAELVDYEYTNVNDTVTTVEELLELFRHAKGNWCPEDYEPEVEEDEEE